MACSAEASGLTARCEHSRTALRRLAPTARYLLLFVAFLLSQARTVPLDPPVNSDTNRDLQQAAECRYSETCPTRGAVTTVPFLWQSGLLPVHLGALDLAGVPTSLLGLTTVVLLSLALLLLVLAMDLSFGPACGTLFALGRVLAPESTTSYAVLANPVLAPVFLAALIVVAVGAARGRDPLAVAGLGACAAAAFLCHPVITVVIPFAAVATLATPPRRAGLAWGGALLLAVATLFTFGRDTWLSLPQLVQWFRSCPHAPFFQINEVTPPPDTTSVVAWGAVAGLAAWRIGVPSRPAAWVFLALTVGPVVLLNLLSLASGWPLQNHLWIPFELQGFLWPAAFAGLLVELLARRLPALSFVPRLLDSVAAALAVLGLSTGVFFALRSEVRELPGLTYGDVDGIADELRRQDVTTIEAALEVVATPDPADLFPALQLLLPRSGPDAPEPPQRRLSVFLSTGEPPKGLPLSWIHVSRPVGDTLWMVPGKPVLDWAHAQLRCLDPPSSEAERAALKGLMLRPRGIDQVIPTWTTLRRFGERGCRTLAAEIPVLATDAPPTLIAGRPDVRRGSLRITGVRGVDAVGDLPSDHVVIAPRADAPPGTVEVAWACTGRSGCAPPVIEIPQIPGAQQVLVIR